MAPLPAATDRLSMYYYHATPKRNLESIGRHGLLSGRRVLELNVGKLTTGQADGAIYIHVSDTIDKCVKWFREIVITTATGIHFSDYGYLWHIIRIDPSDCGVDVIRDPQSKTGLALKTDCISPNYLNYRFGEDYQPDEPDEICGVKVWKTFNP
jgi:hypothetical protein